MSQELGEGKIELIIGPMFSGKSTRLIGLIRKYTYKFMYKYSFTLFKYVFISYE